nr:hypothetical protein BdHM001_36160 [Bdellovibrio sp. HM001]
MEFSALVKATASRYNEENTIVQVSESGALITFLSEENGKLKGSQVMILPGSEDNRVHAGVHLRNADPDLLADAIESALRDGFSKIFIHSHEQRRSA